MTAKPTHSEMDFCSSEQLVGTPLRVLVALQSRLETQLRAAQPAQARETDEALYINLQALEWILREVRAALIDSNKRLQDRSLAHLGIGCGSV